MHTRVFVIVLRGRHLSGTIDELKKFSFNRRFIKIDKFLFSWR